MSRRMQSYTAAAAGLLLLTACSSTTQGAATPAPQPLPPSTAPVPTSSTAAPATTGSTASVGYAQPGAKFHFGQKADVPFKSENVTGTLGLAVTGIDKGAPSDLAPLELGDKANDLTPYYLRVTVTDDSGGNFAYTSAPPVRGLLPDGSDAQEVAVFTHFDKCDNAGAGRDFTTTGAGYQTCVLVLAPGTTPVSGAGYDNSEYTSVAPNTDYGSAPLTWQP
ncbi:hypothetical protein [Amycolatopsis sp. NPDC004378]